MVCPWCLHDLEDGYYFSSKVFAKDPSASNYVLDSWLSLLQDGIPVWVISDKGDFGC